MKIIFLLYILLVPLNFAWAGSCQKNGTCKHRFQIQNDPYDFERESSRSHVAMYFSLSMAANRYMQGNNFNQLWGHSPTVGERILLSTLTFFTFSVIKDLAYDPDGLSRSDIANNMLGVALEIPFEFALFN